MSERVERDLFDGRQDARLEATRRFTADAFDLLFLGRTPSALGDAGPDELDGLLQRRGRQLGRGNRRPWNDDTWPWAYGVAALGSLLTHDLRQPRRDARYGHKLVSQAEANLQAGGGERGDVHGYIHCLYRRIELNNNQPEGKSSAHRLFEHLIRFASDDADWRNARLERVSAKPTPGRNITDPILARVRRALDAARGIDEDAPEENQIVDGLFLVVGGARRLVPDAMSLGDVLNCLPWPLCDRLENELRDAHAMIRDRAAAIADGDPIDGVAWDQAEGKLRESHELPAAYDALLAFRTLFDSVDDPYRRKSIALGIPYQIGKELTRPEADRVLKLISCANAFIGESKERATASPGDHTILTMESAYRLAWMKIGSEIRMKGSAILASLDTFLGSPVGEWKIRRLSKRGADARRSERGLSETAIADSDPDAGKRWVVAVGLNGRGGSDCGAGGLDPAAFSWMDRDEWESLSTVDQKALEKLLYKNRLWDGQDEKDIWKRLKHDCSGRSVQAEVTPLFSNTFPYRLMLPVLGGGPVWKLFVYYFRQWLMLRDPDDDVAYSEAERRGLVICEGMSKRPARVELKRAFQNDPALSDALDRWKMGGSLIYRDLGRVAPDARIEVFEFFFRRDAMIAEPSRIIPVSETK